MVTILLSLVALSCQGRTPGENRSSQSSFGETLEASFSPSAKESQARRLAGQEKQKLQAKQRQLQAERLKSYSDTSSFGQNP